MNGLSLLIEVRMKYGNCPYVQAGPRKYKIIITNYNSNKTMINVGIIGCGFVGGALKDWLEHNNPECKLFISDPPKRYKDDLGDIDIAFLQIHVPTEDDGTQDLTNGIYSNLS